DTEGRIQRTPITESIQLRRYLEIKAMNQISHPAQQFFELELDKRQNGALRAIREDEKGFPFVHFMGRGEDLLETYFRNSSNEQQPGQIVKLKTCTECHS